MLLSDTLELNSGVETVLEWSQEAVDLLDDGHPSVPLLQALSGLAWIREDCGDQQGSIEAARQSIDRAKEWGMPVWPGALGALGAARLSLGDLGGLTDYERALEAARYQGLTFTESVLSMNLGVELMATRGPAAALQLWPERLELDRQRGFDANVLVLQCSIMQATAYAGRWDEALALADELDESLESSGDLWDILTLVHGEGSRAATQGRSCCGSPARLLGTQEDPGEPWRSPLLLAAGGRSDRGCGGGR